jgi:hypothetical protein
METTMRCLKSLSAAALLTTVSLLATSSGSLAAGQGFGPCTQPGNHAVGAEGPAMSGGQLMAGVGQCRSIAGTDRTPRYYRHRTYDQPYYGEPYGTSPGYHSSWDY